MYDHGLIAPVLALVLWSLIVWLWMYATRLPAMQAAKIAPQDAKHPGSLNALPSGARQVADNYNHLMEQPTIFYAAALATHAAGLADPINVGLGWSYVSLRILHSIVQGTVNIVPLRFLIFSLATFALAAMVIRAAMGLWG